MSIKTILAHLPDGTRASRVLTVALGLARRFEAHLDLLHVVPLPYAPLVSYGDFAEEAIEAEQRALESDASNIEALVSAARPGAAPLALRTVHASMQPIADIVTRHAHAADLVIAAMPAPSPRFAYRPADVGEDVMIGAGRPVLMVPELGEIERTGERVLVAWNGSREASRVVFDALPILERASEVRILTIDPPKDMGGAGEGTRDILEALLRHGVKAVTAWAKGEGNSAEQILARADALGADLIVMGGYGHSRLRESVLGGATAGILARAHIPVLMSH